MDVAGPSLGLNVAGTTGGYQIMLMGEEKRRTGWRSIGEGQKRREEDDNSCNRRIRSGSKDVVQHLPLANIL